MARIELKNLTKVFAGGGAPASRALDSFTAEIPDGEWLAVAGPSGCGKTTLLRLVAGLEEPTDGDILLDGRSQSAAPPETRNIAMVFQEPSLYPHLTVGENLGFGLHLRGHSRASIAAQVDWAAGLLGLQDCLERPATEISGGQRQRVAIGRALVRRPVAFLFDEPLGSLDAPTRDQLRRDLKRLTGELKATVLYVTHDHAEAMMVGAQIAVLRQGRLQQLGSPLQVYSRPANTFVAGFVGSPAMNLFPGSVTRHNSGWRFQGAGWSFQMQTGPALDGFEGKSVVAGIRPEQIRVRTSPAASESIPATVEAVEELGSERRVCLRAGESQWVARLPAWEPSPAPGTIVALSFSTESVCWFDAQTGILLA